MMKSQPRSKRPSSASRQAGFTLIELMVAVTISLVIVLALIAVFINVTRTNNEMARTNSQIENGRFAIQLLQHDLAHAGFWGTYVPQFDNLTLTTIPNDPPTAVPDPCLAYSTPWDTAYIRNVIGIPVQPVPSGNCAGIVTNRKASTDTLVTRRAATCMAGSSATAGDCEAINNDKVYFQASLCSASAQLGSTATTIRLATTASAVDDALNGKTIRLLSGTGSGQQATISDYDGSSRTATIDGSWATTPDNSTNYTLDAVDYLLATNTAGLPLTSRNCTVAADIRKFISNIYYVRDFASVVGDNIPTLVRSQFDFVDAPGTALQEHQAPVALIEGIEGFRVEYGIDNVSDSGGAVNYAAAVAWADPANQVSPTNRGDGNVDSFVRCPEAVTAGSAAAPSTFPAAAVCTFTQLTDVVAARVYVLARSRDVTPGYTDTKTYALGQTTLGPFNDGFKRHVFSTAVRLTNVSGRRETP